jgi:hypothetical protein
VVGGFLLISASVDREYSARVDMDVAPGSRERAEIEARENARRLEAVQARSYATRVEIVGPDIDGAAEALEEMIRRLVLPPASIVPGAGTRELIVGRVPDTLPLDLPLPPASQVHGSTVIGENIWIYVETETGPRQILDFYRSRLAPPAWRFLGERRDLGGFAPASMPEFVNTQFCPEGEGPAVSFGATAAPGGSTDLHINVRSDLRLTPCGNPESPPAWEYTNRQPQLPILRAPPGSTFDRGGGSGGADYWESHGFLYTDDDAERIAESYARQFEADGWQEDGSGRDDVAIWSRWDSHDREGQPVYALFLAVRPPGAHGYELIARVTRPGNAV